MVTFKTHAVEMYPYEDGMDGFLCREWRFGDGNDTETPSSLGTTVLAEKRKYIDPEN